MECDLIRLELVSFYFGEAGDDVRARAEAHLCQCRACLEAYLALKRSIEVAAVKPSEQARLRLRDAVARELSRSEPGPWSWWERPLAVTFAAAAALLLTATVNQL